MAERDLDAQAEILRLRERMHKAENLLAAHNLLIDYVPGLVSFKDKLVGIVIGVSVVVSVITTLVTLAIKS